MIKLNEAQDLNLYKKIINIFSDFIDRQPGTGMSKIYKKLLDCGMKCLPKDKLALDMLEYVVTDNVPKSVQDLTNTSFCELPITVRPLYKSGNSKLVAFWNREGKIYSKVLDLLNLEGGSAKGSWTDEKGNPVKLLELGKEE